MFHIRKAVGRSCIYILYIHFPTQTHKNAFGYQLSNPTEQFPHPCARNPSPSLNSSILSILIPCSHLRRNSQNNLLHSRLFIFQRCPMRNILLLHSPQALFLPTVPGASLSFLESNQQSDLNTYCFPYFQSLSYRRFECLGY